MNLIKGTVLRKKNNIVTVKVGDVGYEIILSPAHAAGVSSSQNIELVTHKYIRENAEELYGFHNFEELDFFRMLMSVSGVGPKSASYILSLGTVNEIQNAIKAGDIAFLTNLSGIGKKTAERIVVELKDKVVSLIEDEPYVYGASQAVKDVIDALTSMGYKKNELGEVVKKASQEGGSAEEILRRALKMLAQ